ncbi:hypothetical protein BDZ85DRAFT_261160 [Elsinoe ampelina]|uniref:Aminoglycoside phosphotransferase domain-containing protein n=1 Tax=Elsinoe ampelina TaxID=302913 RepID=A0A6A6GG05_9PEZI|nr:hypothetical protein BDZ85DRAFT_261160 [Elsinoe ampelina]
MMDEASGESILDTWHLKNPREKAAILEQVVDIQATLLSNTFATHGSLYRVVDARRRGQPNDAVVRVQRDSSSPLSTDYQIGSLADLDEYRARTPNRGPWSTAQDWLRAIADNRITHYSARLKSIDGVPQSANPCSAVHQKVQSLAKSRELLGEDFLPRLWHGNDFRADSIFVTGDRVTSITGWRASSICPLPFLATRPDFVQYDGRVSLLYGDCVESRCDLLNRTLNSDFCSRLRRTVNLAASDDNNPGILLWTLIELAQHWDEFSNSDCPVEYSETEMEKSCSTMDDWNAAAAKWDGIGDMVSRDGWVSNENYEVAQSVLANGAFYSCKIC